MPLTANFLADFSSFLGEVDKSIGATRALEGEAARLGPAFDAFLAEASAAAEKEAEAVQKAQDDAKKLGEDIGKALLDVGKKATAFVQGFIKDFKDGEEASARLAVAVKNAGLPESVLQTYAEMAASFQKISLFGDDALTGAQAILTTLGGIKPDAMQETLRATMELATGMKIDLVAAAKLVGTAAQTNGEDLGKMRKALEENLKPGADFAGVMQAIFATFGGSNAAAVGTTAGQMTVLRNQMESINQEIGKVFAENLKTILGLFKELPEWLQTTILGVIAIGTVIAPVLTSLAALFTLLANPMIGTAFTAAIGAIETSLLGLAALLLFPEGEIAVAVIAFAAALWIYWSDIVAGAKWMVETTIKWWDQLVAAAKNVVMGISVWLRDRLTAIIDYAASLPQRVVAAFLWAYDQLVGHSIVPDLISGIGREFGQLDRVMVDPAWAAAADANAAFASVGAAGLPTLAAGAGGASGAPITVTITLNGMMGTDDPQTRALLRDTVSAAMMDAMRGSRLMGTA